MKITLVGMSNTGKSWWSKRLQKGGFIRYCCDDFIEAKLEDKLKVLGYSGIADVSKWLGQPYDERYEENAKHYLDLEIEVTSNVLKKLDDFSDETDIVIDTTGSVIYTGQDVLDELKAKTKVVYLDTPSEIQDRMSEQYLKKPKPVIWGDQFNQLPNETNKAAIMRCYPKLLTSREAQYQAISEAKVDYFDRKQASFTNHDFLNAIQATI